MRILIGLIWTLGVSAHAAPIEELGSRLIALRAEVEEKGRDLQEVQRESSGRLETFMQRRTELETQLRKEQLRSMQLSEKFKVLRGKAGQAAPNSKEEYEQLGKWAADLNRSVRDSLPFRRTERLAALDAIVKKIEKRLDSPVTLAGELWTFTERELKLTADNEYLIGKVELDGQVKEAEIARIGMIQIMFKTSQGENGYALFQDGAWTLVKAESGEQTSAIDRGVKKFKERNVSGWLEIPGMAALIGKVF